MPEPPGMGGRLSRKRDCQLCASYKWIGYAGADSGVGVVIQVSTAKLWMWRRNPTLLGSPVVVSVRLGIQLRLPFMGHGLAIPGLLLPPHAALGPGRDGHEVAGALAAAHRSLQCMFHQTRSSTCQQPSGGSGMRRQGMTPSYPTKRQLPAVRLGAAWWPVVIRNEAAKVHGLSRKPRPCTQPCRG